MQYTIFTCGVLYGKFAPGRLDSSRIGFDIGDGHKGDYLVNVRDVKINAPLFDVSGKAVEAAQDVAMMVVQALDIEM